MSIGGHDGRRRVGAALCVSRQLGGGGRDATGKRVDDHRLADNAGRRGQAVHEDGLCIAVRQVGTVYLDGCAADLVGGVNTGGGAADVGLDECQIVLFTVICPDAAMDTGCCKTLGRADAARNFFILHLKIPLISNLSVSLPSIGAVAARQR